MTSNHCHLSYRSRVSLIFKYRKKKKPHAILLRPHCQFWPEVVRQNRKQSRSFFIKKQNQISFVHHFPLPFHLVYKLVHLSHLSSWVQKQYKIITRYNNNTKKVVNMYSCFFKEYYFHDLHLQLHFIKSGEQYEEKKFFALVSSQSINSIYIEGENQAGKNLPVLPQPTLSHSLSFLSPHLPPLSPSTPQQRRKKNRLIDSALP